MNRHGWSLRPDRSRRATPLCEESVGSAAPSLTYPEVGASAGDLPNGYRHLTAERHLGSGTDRFQQAVERLMTWDMHRRAGLLVDVTTTEVIAGQVAVLTIMLGPVPIRAPVCVVDVAAEPTVQGFAYGTLPGHPESGEERFLVHHDPDDEVRVTIRAYSRPARWYAKLAGPLSRRIQDRTTQRYLDALSAVP